MYKLTSNYKIFTLKVEVVRRALRGEDKVAFDSIMNKVRAHASSCTVTPMLEPMDAIG
jgi:hypothetical protein